MGIGRGLRVAAAMAVSALVAGCGLVGDVLGGSPVFQSAVDPVELDLTAPAYTAAVPGGLLVRHGDDRVVVPRAEQGYWLPDGRSLTSTAGRLQVVDPATGPVGPRVFTFTQPGTAVGQVDLLRQPSTRRLSSYDLDLSPLPRLTLPDTDNPDAAEDDELERGYYGAVATIDGVTYVQWHDGSETYEDGDYGVLRIEGDDLSNVLVNQRIVSLWLTPDGAALLAVRQVSGQPCGGCLVDQEVVELDPATGEIVGEYGMPDDYSDEWRVQAIDKVGDRVAVRFYTADPEDVFHHEEPTGTWVFDGDWELLEGSEDTTTWWQGPDDRIEARPVEGEPARRDGYQLVWVSGDSETELPGELVWSRGSATAWGTVAGRLLPPAD